MQELLFSLDVNTAKKLSLLTKQQKIRRVCQGVYTSNLTAPLASIVKSHWMKIIPYLVSNAVLSFRTAVDLKPVPYQTGLDIVFLTSSYNKTITLPGLVIKIYQGKPGVYCQQVLPNLARSTVPRMLLENLTVVRSQALKGIKTIGEEGVERYLLRELQLQGEKSLNQLRDEAKQVASDLGYQHEYDKLSKTVSALLSTQEASLLKTPYAKSFVKKEPYDERRLQLFENLSFYLNRCFFKERQYHFNEASFRNLSFFESYFSNFIEGTEFILDEAEDIVFKGEEVNQRHADSHDILSNFYLTQDYVEMSRTPNSTLDFLDILKRRHAYLMKERPEKNPGEFKNKANRAGNTYFVAPENVIGTLTRGFEIYQLLKEGLQRALFIHFLISEIHPFSDGNGRLSRIMMNSELVQANLFKIIVPTVCRDNYLGGLRRATRDSYFHTYCKVIDQLQAYTQSIPWSEYGESREKIEKHAANETPDEGLPIFNRVLRGLEVSELAL